MSSSKRSTNASSVLALFLFINLLLFALVAAACDNSPPNPIKKPKHKPKHKHKSPKSSPSPPKYPFPAPPNPYISPIPPVPYLSPPKSYVPSPPKSYFPSPPKAETCPRDALKLEVCAHVLGGLVGVIGGTPPKKPCCSLFGGLVDLEAAVCLCTAIKANVLGVNLNIPLSFSLILNVCQKNVPPGFQCA